MNEIDNPEFKTLMAVIAETYGSTLTGTRVELWWQIFKDYPLELFRGAVHSHMVDPDVGMFEPKPASIMKYLTGTTKQQEDSVTDRTGLAWSCILGEISRVGPYQALKLADKQALSAVKNMGGWTQLCESTYSDLTWKQKEFVECYKTLERSQLEHLPDQLPGLVEMHEKISSDRSGMSSLMSGLDSFLESTKKNNGDQA